MPQYFTLDRLGSVIALTDSTGLTTAAPTYDPWGVTTSPAPTNPTAAANRYGYASGYTDPGTGLIKYGTRYYAPLLGVWTQADPASQGANYYIYAGSNPITNTDPTGRDWDDFAEDAGIVVGAFAGGLAAGVGTLCGPAVTFCGSTAAGAAAGAVGNLTDQAIGGDGDYDWGDVGESTGVGALAGAAAGVGLTVLEAIGLTG